MTIKPTTRGVNWLGYIGAKYEATAKIGQGVLAVYFIGFGDTRLEAMDKCFSKINKFLKK